MGCMSPHSSHVACPTSAWYVPSGQGWHASVPPLTPPLPAPSAVAFLWLPLGQGAHTPAVLAPQSLRYIPASQPAHGVHVVAPSCTEYELAAHISQVPELFAVHCAWRVPAGQTGQGSQVVVHVPSSALKVSAPHTSHTPPEPPSQPLRTMPAAHGRQMVHVGSPDTGGRLIMLVPAKSGVRVEVQDSYWWQVPE